MSTRALAAGPSPAQLRKLHALKRALGLDDDTYRDVLARYGAASSKDLDGRKLEKLLDEFETKALAMGVWTRPATPAATRAARRPGAASGAQLAMLRAMWRQVSRATTNEARAAALDALAKRQTGVERLDWLDHAGVQVMVKTLEAMGAERR